MSIEEIERLAETAKKFMVIAMMPYVYKAVKKQYVKSLPIHRRIKYYLTEIYDWLDYKIWCLKEKISELFKWLWVLYVSFWMYWLVRAGENAFIEWIDEPLEEALKLCPFPIHPLFLFIVVVFILIATIPIYLLEEDKDE